MSTRAIIFDYGNVLDIPMEWQAWLDQREKIAARLGLTGDALWSVFYRGDEWQKVKRGQITVEEYYDTLLRPLGFSDAAAQIAFVDEIFAGRDKIHPEMVKLLHELRPLYKLALLSNIHLVDMDIFLEQERGLAGIFDVIVSSAKVGMAKPDREIYELTLDRLGVVPGEALFIDDMVRNTSVAEALGIPCIVFESPTQLRRELASRGIFPKKD
jgi:epoxide hydrolase-like predicted phosphatase